MANDPETKLRPVPEPGSREDDAPASELAETSPPTNHPPLWSWLAVAAFVVCAMGWAMSYSAGESVRDELTATQAELAATEADLAAHQAHLDTVRSSADALATSLSELTTQADALSALAAEPPPAQ